MQDNITLRLLIRGNFESGEFPDWICHRAGVLNLSGWVKVHDVRFIEVLASGDPILVEALEVACSIGPFSVLVDDIETVSTDNIQNTGNFNKLD